jgi:hypothetical protein
VRCQYTPVTGAAFAGVYMHRRLWPLLPLGTLTFLAIALPASASVGVGIQAGPVLLAGAAHPGGSYQLPPVYVVNTGTQQETITIRIERISSGRGRTVPESWIKGTGQSLALSRHQSTRVPLELVVPGTAKPGWYFSDVVVKGSAGLAVGAASRRVAAATELKFTVAPGLAAGPWLSLPGWLPFVLAGIAVLAAAAYAVRRSGLRIRIERQPG